MTAKHKTRKSSKSTALTVTREEIPKPSEPFTEEEKAILAEEHLTPLPLVFTILACSGFLWILGIRDVMGTGKIILGDMDAAYLEYSNSMQWFDDSMGWKSKQGGLSAVEQVSTDQNDMGGLFVRKVGGLAIAAVHAHKLIPVLFHPAGAQWNKGHFRPLMWTAFFANMVIASFYVTHLEDMTNSGAGVLPTIILSVLALETGIILYYLATQKRGRGGPAVALPEGKTPKSVPSRILSRTVLLISGLMCLIAGRDLFFPGSPIDFIPRDDIYLEWTGAFLHSPPEGSAEAADQGITAPLHAGDKFSHQLMALHVLLMCLYKAVTGFGIRYGFDGSGMVKCRMIWQTAALCGFLLTLLMRLFVPAAKSASLDMRWHLMSVCYEAFIFFLYGFF